MANTTLTQFPAGQTQYKINFDYLARPFVVVTLVNSNYPAKNRVLTVGNDYGFLSPTTIEIYTSQVGFDILQISRFTSTESLVDFRDGSVLTATDLTNAELQAIHIAEEGRDQTLDMGREYAEMAQDAYKQAANTLGEILRIGSMGYFPVGSFEAGGTVSVKNQVLTKGTGDLMSYWRWDGVMPKTVPENSSPESTGGIAQGAWIQVNDIMLANLIKRYHNSEVLISELGLSDTDAAYNAITLDRALRVLEPQGIDTIIVDKEYTFDVGYDWTEHYPSRRIGRVSNFFWRGKYELKGLDPMYPVHITKEWELPAITYNGTDLKIGRRLEGETVTVVMFGDSISAEWADSISHNSSQWETIKAEMRRQNPTVKFSFVNRAIGGQTWLHANTKPTAFPEWYTDTSLDWTYYVVQPSPDIVIFAFGMNDSVGFNMGTMVACTEKIKRALPNAALVFIPCLVPSRSSDYSEPIGSGRGFDGFFWQNGRNSAAGAERTYARSIGASVWDFNHYINQTRDSIDIMSCALKEVPNAVPTNGAYIAPPCIDFSFEFKVVNWDASKPITIGISADEEDRVFIGESNGMFAITARTEYIGNYYETPNPTVPVIGTNFWMTAGVVNEQFSIFVHRIGDDGITDKSRSILIASFPVIRHGGMRIRPWIGQGGNARGNISEIRVMTGLPVSRKKTLRDTDIWGLGDASPKRRDSTGGNGINHPSAHGLATIVNPVLRAQDLRIKYLPFVFSTKLGDGMGVTWGAPEVVKSGNYLTLTGDIKKVGLDLTVENVLFTILEFDRLKLKDYKTIFGMSMGYGDGGAPTCLLKVYPDGRVVNAVSVGKVNGIVLNGVSIKV